MTRLRRASEGEEGKGHGYTAMNRGMKAFVAAFCVLLLLCSVLHDVWILYSATKAYLRFVEIGNIRTDVAPCFDVFI